MILLLFERYFFKDLFIAHKLLDELHVSTLGPFQTLIKNHIIETMLDVEYDNRNFFPVIYKWFIDQHKHTITTTSAFLNKI